MLQNRNVISLSLTLAFFNLLPLPNLDGRAILLSFFHCLHAPAPSLVAMEEGLRGGKAEKGLLAGLVERARVGKWASRMGVREGEEERAVRAVEKWTMALAVLVGACSLLVELVGG
ncbi:hypothetical protein P7C70_g3511, partial [Phenoliferia sp. Uapishka_3]